VKRGEVWWVLLDEKRPVVLLSPSDAGSWQSIQVVPPADTDITGLAVEVKFGAEEGLSGGVVRVALPQPGLVPCTWLAVVTSDDLIEQAGQLSPGKLREVDGVLRQGGIVSL
jgi:mRNA interferase MazF